MHSIQIFVYNTNRLHANNNYPLLLFETEEKLIAFLDGLQYESNSKLLRNVIIDDNCIGNGFTEYIQTISS